jgi:RNA polymerase subunit RPABC4/transcription elongation factor Spt4
MIINPEILPDIITALTILGAAFLVSLWISLVVWTFRDIRKRTRDAFIIILSILVVIIFFIPGIIIYLLLRPNQTVEESFQNALEEEALLHTIEETELCPGCNRQVQSEWRICPTCKTRLKRSCTVCHKPLELQWEICPFCAQPVSLDKTGPSPLASDVSYQDHEHDDRNAFSR